MSPPTFHQASCQAIGEFIESMPAGMNQSSSLSLSSNGNNNFRVELNAIQFENDDFQWITNGIYNRRTRSVEPSNKMNHDCLGAVDSSAADPFLPHSALSFFDDTEPIVLKHFD